MITQAPRRTDLHRRRPNHVVADEPIGQSLADPLDGPPLEESEPTGHSQAYARRLRRLVPAISRRLDTLGSPEEPVLPPHPVTGPHQGPTPAPRGRFAKLDDRVRSGCPPKDAPLSLGRRPVWSCPSASCG
jgi:hypothetical protein